MQGPKTRHQAKPERSCVVSQKASKALALLCRFIIMAAVQAPPNLSAPGEIPQQKSEKPANERPGGSPAQAPKKGGATEAPPLALLKIFSEPATAASGTDGNALAGKTATLSNGPLDGTNPSTFQDFTLKPELLRVLADRGFKKPSAVQQECFPEAFLGKDVIKATKANMDKIRLYVLATLQQLVPVDGVVSVLVMCHSKQLVNEIKTEYDRFVQYMPGVKTAVASGESLVKANIALLKKNPPHVMVATPSRLKDLMNRGVVKLNQLKHLVLDEADALLVNPNMRVDVEAVYMSTPPKKKQVMLFAETMSVNVQAFCRDYYRGGM